MSAMPLDKSRIEAFFKSLSHGWSAPGLWGRPSDGRVVVEQFGTRAAGATKARLLGPA